MTPLRKVRFFLIWLCWLGGWLTVRGATTAPPNILFLFADDQRADTIAALGNRAIRTPNLDRLVRSGLSFKSAYMQGSTNSVTCVPSRAMLLSGRSPRNVYEHSVRVPLIVAGPGIPAGRTTDALCYLFDLLPTLGKVCGVAGPATSEGIDFSATLRDPRRPARTELFFAYKDGQRAVRNRRWKLIRYPQVDKTQLFDLKSDPDETVNLAGTRQHQVKVKEMTRLLETQMRVYDDPTPARISSPKQSQWTPPAPISH